MSNVIENIVFITTALVCALFVFVTQTLEKISNNDKYIQSLKKELKMKHEHIMKCILYKAVCISQSIHSIKITDLPGPVFVNFKNICILDKNDDKIEYTINRQKQSYGYQISNYSTNPENRKHLIIQFCSVSFKSIEFVGLHIGNTRYVSVILISQNTETTIKMKQEKNIICNTSVFHKNHN